jgi:outer membrane protein OmpA-like peptidoglycan-associated protein
LRLVGGINIMQPKSWLEFSEIIGNGTQETPALATNFQGVWRTAANRVRLIQRGPVVSGCYDGTGDLDGTVSGNVLRATGLDPAPPALGCGAVIHGINFDFNSSTIRPESNAVLAELFTGLKADRSAKIVIEGHTSSEGTDDYNRQLSERRANAVVADLVRRGLAVSRLNGAGIGEARPIASNNDESGRAMNRRVEIRCR